MSAKSSKKSAKVSQEELRKLMKQKTQTKRIDSPYSRYDSLDKLTCSVCAKVIKSNQLWEAHVLSKPHKEMVERMQMQGPKSFPIPKSETQKRKSKSKSDPSTTPPPPEPPPKVIKSILKNSNNRAPETSLAHPTPSSTNNNNNSNNTNDNNNNNNNLNNKNKNNNNNLNNKNNKINDNNKAPIKEEGIEVIKATPSLGSNSAIPEGFFDDPKLDAKARNIKYVDKMEEEMELFQKEIKQAEQENQVLVEEEDELTSEQKSLDQLDEEINLWSKPFSLARNKDEKLLRLVEKIEVKEERVSDDEDVDLTSLMDWRSKVPFKK